MTAKKINFLIILFILLFCFVGGFVGVYYYILKLALIKNKINPFIFI